MKKLYVILLFFIIVSCREVVTPKQYIQIANAVDGPFAVTVIKKEKEITCFYRPYEYYVAKNTVEGFDQDSSYKSGIYFNVIISFNESSNESYQLLQLLTEDRDKLNKKFVLIKNEKRIKPLYSSLTPSPDRLQYNFLVVFPDSEIVNLRKTKLAIQNIPCLDNWVEINLAKINPSKLKLNSQYK